MAFPTAFDPAGRSYRLTVSRPLPCNARRGNRINNAYAEEMGVSADGPSSAPPSGPAAVAPPMVVCFTIIMRLKQSRKFLQQVPINRLLSQGVPNIVI
jgi:hypothetical protein